MLAFELHYQQGDFSLQAEAEIAGGATGIFGPSGAGKSTLLALIAGLLRPQRGTFNFDGVSLIDTARGQCTPSWQRHIGLVFQDGQLFPHLSVRDNLLYGFRNLKLAERRFQLQMVLQLLEIGSLLARSTQQLSGGERQRVALGRALLYSPKLLLLDEPLSSLDARLKQQILPFLKRVKEETRLPMLYVSHDRAELDYLADRVLRLEDGKLSQPPQESHSMP